MLITCDESKDFKIKVIGSFSIPRENFFEFEDFCTRERYKNNVFGEIKWGKINKKGKYFDFYLNLLEKAFSFPLVKFHSNSYIGEQYKASYSLFRSISWKLTKIHKGDLKVLYDFQGKKGASELKIINDCTNNDNSFSHKLSFCNQCDSKMFNIMQLTDLLTGSIAYKINNSGSNKTCDLFISCIEDKIENGLSLILTYSGLWPYNNKKKIQYYELPHN